MKVAYLLFIIINKIRGRKLREVYGEIYAGRFMKQEHTVP